MIDTAAGLESEIRFHHMGLLTGNAEDAARFLQALGYRLGEAVTDPLQEAVLRMAHGRDGSPDIEIISPLPDNAGLRKLLKRRDDYLYHLCFTTSDREKSIAALTAAKEAVMEVSPPKPTVLFEGKTVSFHVVSGLGLIELLEI